MPNPKATLTQAEATRYLKALREAGFGEGRIEIERPDGTKVRIVAGKVDAAAPDNADDIDAMIERAPDAAKA